jgi:hypothetical protein
MHDGIVVSGVFAVTGLALLVAGAFLVPALAHIDVVVQAFGLLLLLFVPFILITTYLRTAAQADGADDSTGTRRSSR